MRVAVMYDQWVLHLCLESIGSTAVQQFKDGVNWGIQVGGRWTNPQATIRTCLVAEIDQMGMLNDRMARA